MKKYSLPVLFFCLLFFVGCTNEPPMAEPAEVVAVVADGMVEETAVTPSPVPTNSPTSTLAPSATSNTTPSEPATMIPIPTPTVSIRVLAGTAVPQSNQPINTDNVTQLTELARYGRFAQQLPDDAAETQAVTELPSYRIPLH